MFSMDNITYDITETTSREERGASHLKYTLLNQYTQNVSDALINV